MKPESCLAPYLNRLSQLEPVIYKGRVTKVTGLSIESIGPHVHIGSICHIRGRNPSLSIPAEVVGFKDGRVMSMALGEMNGIEPGAEIWSKGSALQVRVSPKLLGRILDGLGNPLDFQNLPSESSVTGIYANPPNPLARKRINEVLPTGIRAIDGFLTCGKGQRFGIFAGSGVGKSTLLGMVARHAMADLNVIALIGERGREVKEFIERDLGPEGMERSVVVVATSDQPALVRLKAALVATSIAEFFRDQGKDVILMMDSVTRYAMAQREVGLAVGEPPTTRGYTPSVFAALPKLLERAGTSDKGTITGIYTVLVDGDDMNEPVADAVRGILDGHIILSRTIAARNHYPPIDILGSVSRVMSDIVPPGAMDLAREGRKLMATYEEARDLISIGAYVKGTNAEIDRSIDLYDGLNAFLRQERNEFTAFDDSQSQLSQILYQ